MIKHLLIIFFVFCALEGFSQECLVDIDMSKVPYKEVRNLIKVQQNCSVNCINDLKASCGAHQSLKEYNKQVKSYKINKPVNEVWANYIKESPSHVYNSKKFSFGLMLCKKNQQQKIVYSKDQFGNLDTGQVIYLKLKFLKGLYKMAVAFEIISIDTLAKKVELSYVKGGNKSDGKQVLQFVNKGNSETEIIHTSYYKSENKIRDKFFYPFFHGKVTNEFHRNFKRLMNLSPAEKEKSNKV